MFITFHLSSSVILSLLLFKMGYLDFDLILFAISGGILPDIDIFAGTLHRNLASHTPIFWFILAIFGVIFYPIFIISSFALVHILLDGLDWGVMFLYPYSKSKFDLRLLKYEPNRDRRLNDFLKKYWSNKSIVLLETACGTVALICVLTILL